MLAVVRLHTSVKLAFRLSCYWMRISRRRKKSDVIHSTRHSEAVTPSVSGAIRGSLRAPPRGLRLSSQEVKARGGWMNESPQARDNTRLQPGSVVLLRPRGFCARQVAALTHNYDSATTTARWRLRPLRRRFGRQPPVCHGGREFQSPRVRSEDEQTNSLH